MYISTISASRGNTYLDCPFKYFLTYEVYICNDCGEPTYISELQHLNISLNDKICLNPDCGGRSLSKLHLPSNWSGMNGSIIHKVLELYACARKEGKQDWRLNWRENFIDAYFGKLEGFRTPSEIFDIMWATTKNQKLILPIEHCSECIYGCNTSIVGPHCPKRLFDQSIEMISEAIERYDYLFREQCLGTEREFKIPLGEYKGLSIIIHGFIDIIFGLSDEIVEVVDYKSGSYTKNSQELMDDNQAGIYSIAAKHLYPKHKCHFLTFDYFVRSPVSVTFSDEDDERMRQRVIKIFQQIVDNKSPRRIPLNRDGSLFYKCQYLCHRPTCDKHWTIFQKRYGRSGL